MTGNPHGAVPGDIGAATAPVVVTVTFTSAGWTLNGTTNCYEQSVAVTGLLTTDDTRTRVEPVGNESDPDAQMLTDEAFSVLAGNGRYVACTTNGYLYARCPPGSDAPAVNFQVYVIILR